MTSRSSLEGEGLLAPSAATGRFKHRACLAGAADAGLFQHGFPPCTPAHLVGLPDPWLAFTALILEHLHSKQMLWQVAPCWSNLNLCFLRKNAQGGSCTTVPGCVPAIGRNQWSTCQPVECCHEVRALSL